ncbi:MAG: penicillin-binding transpeptidase domain-containing protein, partial [Chloroflexota bacterium]
HVFNREKDFGVVAKPGLTPAISQSVGTLEIHPIDLLGAYGTIANQGVLMPRTMMLEVRDHDGLAIYPAEGDEPVGKRVISPQAAYIMSDIMQQSTIKSINPIWGRWQILEKTDNGPVRRPTAYKTGTTDDRKDVLAYGFLAPPDDPKGQGLVVGVWMGNSDSTPNLHRLSFESSAPTWSRIMTEISQNLPIAKFKQPSGIVTTTIDAFSGLLPGPGTVKTIKEIFIKGTEPTRKDNLHVQAQIDTATGLLWQDGCTGPMATKTFLDFSRAEERFPQWQPYTQEWAQRAARGPGVTGGPKRTRTSYFYNSSFHPFGATWGGAFKPTDVCQPLVNCPPEGLPQPTDAIPCIPLPTPTPTASNGNPHPSPSGPQPTKPGGPKPTPTAAPVAVPTAAAAGGPSPAGPVSLALLFPFAPLLTLLLGRRLRPDRPSRPKGRR